MRLFASAGGVLRLLGWNGAGPSCKLPGVHRPTPDRLREQAGASIRDDLAAYRHDLVRRELSADTVRKRVAIVEAFADAMEVRTLGQVTAAAATDFLSGQKLRRRWSAKTHDNHLDSLRDFGAFLESRHAGWTSPLRAIRRARRNRVVYGGDLSGSRAFTEAEQLAIIAVAEKVCSRKRRLGKRTNNRDWCYLVFADTGLRRKEMKSLPWAAVHIDARPFRIVCQRSWTKSRRDQVVPLTDQARDVLMLQRACTGERELVWEFVPHWHTLLEDMEKAGVPHRDSRGRRAGFHSFRKGLNRRLRLGNVDPETRMRWMRHSNPALTLGTYGDVLPADLAAAVQKLVNLGNPGAATGPELHELSTSLGATGPPTAFDLTKLGPRAEDRAGATGIPNPTLGSIDDCSLRPGLRNRSPEMQSPSGQPRRGDRAPQFRTGGITHETSGVRIPPSPLYPYNIQTIVRGFSN